MEKAVWFQIKRWGPIVIWAGVIFLVSSFSTLPTPEIIWWDFALKKSAHMIEYGIFYFLLFRAVNWEKERKNYWLPFLITVAYAMTDEYHQAFIPGRHARVYDVAYDSLGALMSYLRIKEFI